MTLRPSRLALVLGVALLTSSQFAGAQTPAGAGTAEATFRRGMTAMHAGRNAEAVVEFRQSYRLNPLPDVLFNLALALRGAGRYAAAIGAFERYLATAPVNVPRARRDAVRDLLPQLRTQVGSVRLDLAPSDAALLVDGHEVQRVVNDQALGELAAVDPHDARALLLDPGVHVVEASAPGFHAERHEITVRSGSQTNERLVLAREVTVATVVTPHPAEPPVVLREESPSVLTRWWFWTITGVVVGGTIGAVVWFTRDPDAWVSGTRFDVEAIRAR